MYQSDVYERVYFQDDYKQQFEALRSRYHDRTQNALKKRAVNHNPVPNATTIVYLHDEPDGGVRISTGDFVEFFNNRYGGKNRIGAARDALANAVQKAEKSDEIKRVRTEKARRGGSSSLSCSVRFSRCHMVFVNALFALMLMVSVALLGASGVMLERSEADIAALEVKAAEESVVAADMLMSAGESSASDAYFACTGENSVSVFEVSEKEDGFEEILNALAYLWQEQEV